MMNILQAKYLNILNRIDNNVQHFTFTHEFGKSIGPRHFSVFFPFRFKILLVSMFISVPELSVARPGGGEVLIPCMLFRVSLSAVITAVWKLKHNLTFL